MLLVWLAQCPMGQEIKTSKAQNLSMCEGVRGTQASPPPPLWLYGHDGDPAPEHSPGTHSHGQWVGFCATGKGCSAPQWVGPAPLTGPAGLLRVQHLMESRSLLTSNITLQLLKSLSLTSPLIFKSDRPLKTFILSLQVPSQPSCAPGLPMGSAHLCCLRRESGRSENQKWEKSFQSFLLESFRAHDGMAGKKCPAGRRLLFLTGQIQSYLSGKGFPSLSETSKLLYQVESHHHLNSEYCNVCGVFLAPSKTQCTFFALLTLLTTKLTCSICLGFFVVDFPIRWCFLPWSLLESI